ncbi:molybdopterin-guanine dinucleotide biosynthesis protein MobB/molybdenum cofactor guanylyltransferase,TIGR02665 [Ensifer adhaerens]|nr:molybdopterin-guanine dinucleotide biosynthesis protein MobB/molybdenum cofactor guanylyltransferase,TIGR02665 [Ensifer adhaerens]
MRDENLPKFPGMVLAGGRSSRMGEDKAAKRLAGKPLARIVAARLSEQATPLLINTGNTALAGIGYDLLPDTIEGQQGPLAGILAGLEHVLAIVPATSHLAVVPADAPFFPETLVSRLTAAIEGPETIAMAAYCGDPEPAFALWPVALTARLRYWLEMGESRAIRAFAATCDVRLVDFVDEPPHSFFNVNRPRDFERARDLMGLGRAPKILGISGWKNSGKTGLTVRLVEELTARGYRVSTIKHAHHDFDIDKVGADSFRHRQAGAHEVTIVSGTRYAIMHELRGNPEPAFEEVLSRLAPCDIVVIEGYKREPVPKIEARRLEAKSHVPLAPEDPHIVAIAADHAVEDAGLPVFDLDDTQAIADFAERLLGFAGDMSK